MAYGDTIIKPVKKPEREYTDAELKEFDKELEPYKEVGALTGNKVLLHKGWVKYMVEKGVCSQNKDGSYSVIGVKTMSGGIDTSKYEELVHKFTCLSNYQGRIKYGEKQKLKQYEESLG